MNPSIIGKYNYDVAICSMIIKSAEIKLIG